MDRPAVTVVVATKDRADLLERLLESLEAQTLTQPFEVVVVDDGSTDRTPELLAAHGSALDLRVERNDTSIGAGGARDRGWRIGRAPLVAFTDDDCVATPGWLRELVRAAGSAPGGVVMGRTLPDPAERRSPFTRSVVVEAAGPPYETCNILYPRDLLERLDGFDPRFWTCGEDTDLGWRAVRSGAPLAFAPDALVHHAVHRLGPVGALRVAPRWEGLTKLYRHHPDLRRVALHRGIFWSPVHEQMFLALAALLLPRRVWPLSLLLLVPYARRLAWRRSGPVLAPFILLTDLIELAAVLRGAVRERVLIL